MDFCERSANILNFRTQLNRSILSSTSFAPPFKGRRLICQTQATDSVAKKQLFGKG